MIWELGYAQKPQRRRLKHTKSYNLVWAGGLASKAVGSTAIANYSQEPWRAHIRGNDATRSGKCPVVLGGRASLAKPDLQTMPRTPNVPITWHCLGGRDTLLRMVPETLPELISFVQIARESASDPRHASTKLGPSRSPLSKMDSLQAKRRKVVDHGLNSLRKCFYIVWSGTPGQDVIARW